VRIAKKVILQIPVHERGSYQYDTGRESCNFLYFQKHCSRQAKSRSYLQGAKERASQPAERSLFTAPCHRAAQEASLDMSVTQHAPLLPHEFHEFLGVIWSYHHSSEYAAPFSHKDVLSKRPVHQMKRRRNQHPAEGNELYIQDIVERGLPDGQIAEQYELYGSVGNPVFSNPGADQLMPTQDDYQKDKAGKNNLAGHCHFGVTMVLVG
jgi:hypothetical protein